MPSNLKAVCPKCSFSYIIPLEQALVRSLPQNNLYWGVYIRIIADELGYFPDELHEELKLLFNAKDSKLVVGDKVGGSTKRMTRKEFIEYLDKIRMWAQIEHGIILPGVEDETK